MSSWIIHAPEAPQPPATHSQAVRAGSLVFVSGTGPYDPRTGAIVGSTIQEQVRQCLSNIAAILTAAGSSLDRVVSTTVILRHAEDFDGLNEEWVRWFPAQPPARQGAQMPIDAPGLKVSVAAIAEV